MLKQFFITGTDTGVGKTLVSAVIAKAIQADYWKPIQSGLADELSDQEKIRQLVNVRAFDSSYALQASLSPDQAAECENIIIDMKKCILPTTNNHLVIEGVGGVFVPLNDKHCLIDLMEQCQIPIIIVARGTLGTINHTLLTIEVLRKRNLMVHGIVFSGKLNPKNQLAIEKWGNVATLFHIPHFEYITPTNLQIWIDQNKQIIQEELL